jgi:hypothetical protein
MMALAVNDGSCGSNFTVCTPYTILMDQMSKLMSSMPEMTGGGMMGPGGQGVRMIGANMMRQMSTMMQRMADMQKRMSEMMGAPQPGQR